MGLDLRLLPCEVWSEGPSALWGFAHTMLELGAVSSGAWEAFQEQVAPHLAPLPKGHRITSFVGARMTAGLYKGEHVYGPLGDTDAYGKAYKAVTAQHLVAWLGEHFWYEGSPGNGHHQRAVVAFCRALPPDTKIVLDWH